MVLQVFLGFPSFVVDVPLLGFAMIVLGFAKILLGFVSICKDLLGIVWIC